MPDRDEAWKGYKQAVLDRVGDFSALYEGLERQRASTDGWVTALCPFHEDKTPSFAFHRKSGKWCCFAGCGKGSAFDYLMQTSGKNFREALFEIGDRAGVPRPFADKPARPPIRETLIKEWVSDLWANEDVCRWLREERGLSDATIKKYEVGWDPKRQRYTIPVRDERGDVVNVRLYSAKMNPKIINYTEGHYKYGSPPRLYGVDELARCEHTEVILCEGEWDRLLLRQEGFMAVTGTHGASVFRPDWVPCFKDRDVVILYDCDREGQAAVRSRVLPALAAAGVHTIRAVVLPLTGDKGDKDVTDYFHKRGHTAGGLRKLIDETPICSSETRETIVVRQRLAEVVDEAEAALVANSKSGLYVRSQCLVRAADASARAYEWLSEEAGSPVIEPISRAYLRELLDRSANWVGTRDRPVLVPQWVPETLLARASWPLPPLVAVVETPVLRPDGSVVDRPGYDKRTGLLYLPRGEFPKLPEPPSRDDAGQAALKLLDPLQDFPFEGEASRAAALAAILTLVGRHAIAGCVPLFAIRSPTGGTGKGLLADVISIIGTGRTPARMSTGRDDDEARKRILAVGLRGDPVALLDNADHCLGSESLAAALTSEFFEDRILGASRIVRVPMRLTWFATGNGMTFRATLGRRVVPVDLDARMEYPEERSEFRYPDLRAHVRGRRPELAVAALTILAAYVRAGSPGHGKAPMGSFERWDRLVRGACVWLGLDDPCSGRDRVREEGDADLERMRAVFTALHEALGSAATTVAEIKRKAEERQDGALVRPDLCTALAGVGDGSTLNSRVVGDRFRQWKGRIVNGLCLECEPRKVHGATAWKIRVVGESGESGESFSSHRDFSK